MCNSTGVDYANINRLLKLLSDKTVLAKKMDEFL